MGGAGPAECPGVTRREGSFEAAKGISPSLPGIEMHARRIPGLWGEDVPREGIVPLGSQRSKLGRKKKDIRGLSPSCSWEEV